ncbi:coiled-coil alpha-helical rod protein 1 [Trichomycterus rosablanca]|uniref:coiled-coil alpha-helical rod protein 1 n=1 Tax=Trichomycterus rosablanca TaxID=2290929 RepID=UPI002F352242
MERLTAPSDFIRTNQTGVSRTSTPALLTPSHFTVTCTASTSTTLTPALTSVTPMRPTPAPSLLPLGADPWTLLTQSQQELGKLRQENQRLLQLQLRDTDTHPVHTTDTSHTLHTTHTSASHTVLKEERDELRRDVPRLREELRERDTTISRQCADHEKLCAELQQTRQKVLELQKECGLQLDRERQKSEEDTQQLQRETQHQMQQVCERHRAELSALSQTNSDLQNTVHTLTQEVTSLGRRVEEVTSERDTLREQLSAVSSEMEEQAETLQKLRSYIGTKGGDEEHLAHIQKLQKEKEALCLSVELLNVRVKSVNDILALQEKELGEQCDPLQQDRSVQLLSVWREKVFMLLVQLRSRDSQLHTEKAQLHNTVSNLQQEVQKLQSHIDLLQHNLQDKTAQLQLHNIHTQELQQQLCSVVEKNKKLEQYKEMTEKSLAHITDNVHRMGVCIKQWENQSEAVRSQMRALIHRISFANTRLDTVHGLLMRREALWKAQQATKPPEPSESCIDRLESQVALLSSERDTLAQELRRTPELINNALRDLQLQLDRSTEEFEVCKLRCLEAHTQCKEQERTIAELRAEAHHTQAVLQEKLSEVEGVCAKELREMEAQLNTARREHTKAVVALRQVERAAEREREQEREAERARSEHTLTQITQLRTQLKEKDRDHNILLAVVQQQGLMNEYKKMRRTALHTSKALMDHQPQPKAQQHKQHQEGSVLSVLGELRSLTSAVIHSSDEDEEDEEHGQEDASNLANHIK